MTRKLMIVLSIAICFANPLLAQQWNYANVKFEGKYVAEVYTIKVENGQLTNDSALLSVRSFDDRNYVVEEVEQEGLKSVNIYNEDGALHTDINFYHDRTPIAATKNEREFANGLVSSSTYYKRVKGEWIKEDKNFYTYKFNNKGQIVEETMKGSDGTINYNAYTIYDLKYKPIKPYYDELGNLLLPGSKETAVVIGGDTSHFNCYKFDAEGRVLQFVYAHADRSPSTTHDYRYDAAGRMLGYNYTNGSRLDSRNEYDYNDDGRLIMERKLEPDEAGVLTLVEELHYNYITNPNRKK